MGRVESSPGRLRDAAGRGGTVAGDFRMVLSSHGLKPLNGKCLEWIKKKSK